MSKGFIQPCIKFTTVFRIQSISNKPVTRGFDSIINDILDDYERLIKSAGCKAQPTEVEDTACNTAT